MLKRFVLALIRLYQSEANPRRWLLPAVCRFQPTCSQFMYQAIEVHGILRGSWLATKRILRCHPFHPGGWDPVPGQNPAQETRS